MNEQPSAFPLHRGSAERLARIRTALRAAGFDETTLCRELKIPSMAELGKVRWADSDMNDRPHPLGRWVGVFLFGERVPGAVLKEVFPPEVMESLTEVGLLRPAKADPTKLVCPVFLYPVAGFLIASDRHDDPDGQPGPPRDAQPDVVFPGIFGGTLRFLELLPTQPGDALDLCGGCGIGALCLARTARTALSADITPRATCFAEFNAQLNGCDKVQTASGDLYQAVSDRQFDVITAHPPYVPALGSTMLYRDAGDTGEDITRNIVAGLPAHLRAGGQALILCQGRDAEDGPFEERVRTWLGESHAQFDVVFALQTTKSLEQEAAELARRVNQPTREDLAELLARFRRLGTRQFVYGALSIHRHNSTESVPCTSRTRLSAEARAADFDCRIAWHHRRSQPGFKEWLAQARLRLAAQLELRVRHIVHEGMLIPAEFIFEVDRPFACAMRIDGWVTPLIARLDGATTPSEIHAAALAKDELPKGFELTDFLELLATLIDRGYLIVSGGR